MSRTDLIAEVFTRIRNAHMAKKENLDVPSSTMILAILGILKKESYIDDFKLIQDKKQGTVRIYLKYVAGKPAITKIRRVSRPGLRLYVRKDKVPTVLRGRGMAIISTSHGLITNVEAKEKGFGGEVIGYVW
jgi:small subunit ribosomal protein S8